MNLQPLSYGFPLSTYSAFGARLSPSSRALKSLLSENEGKLINLGGVSLDRGGNKGIIEAIVIGKTPNTINLNISGTGIPRERNVAVGLRRKVLNSRPSDDTTYANTKPYVYRLNLISVGNQFKGCLIHDNELKATVGALLLKMQEKLTQ